MVLAAALVVLHAVPRVARLGCAQPEAVYICAVDGAEKTIATLLTVRW